MKRWYRVQKMVAVDWFEPIEAKSVIDAVYKTAERTGNFGWEYPVRAVWVQATGEMFGVKINSKTHQVELLIEDGAMADQLGVKR
jgi:hypothetical protein